MFPIPRILTALGAVALLGAVRLPLEHHFHGRLKANGLVEDGAGLDFRDQLTQNAFLATLGGFRSLVAAILELDAGGEAEKKNWGKVEAAYRLMQQLQPHDVYYWDTGQSVLTRDIPHSYRVEGMDPAAFAAYTQKGRAMVREGLRFLPKSYRLWEVLAQLHARPFPGEDLSAEIDCWRKAVECPDAPVYARRRLGYALAALPGHEQEAWNVLHDLYALDKRHRLPTLLKNLRILEEKLDIAPWNRIPANETGWEP